jgi:hypothetical protein
MSDQRLYVNGLNGASGGYLTDPSPPEALVEAALGESLTPEQMRAIKSKSAREGQAPFVLAEGLDPKALDQAGWGVIFPAVEGDEARGRQAAIRAALAPLLDRRKAQAGPLYKEYVGPDACRPGESAVAFLERHGSGPGPVDPTAVPYYLMIVADPEAVPFPFQYELDLDFAVGRLHFDEVDDYARYAAGVVRAESAPGPRPAARRAAFFGVRNADDPATEQSADLLLGPLAAKLAAETKADGWDVQTIVGDGQATKPALAALLGGDRTPDLLFTASHGLAFPLGHERQLRHQGAVVCQEWPGPAAWGSRPMPEDQYLSADDVGDSARVGGLITFHFACYGAGTPKLDDFPHPKLKARPTIAPRSFLARLPQRLLAHPGGGALAVVGHVERAWPCSFVWKQAGKQVEVFRSALKRLLLGHPVGSALDYFNGRYAVLSALVARNVEEAKYGTKLDPSDVAYLWTACNDARSYVVLGDPAVRLPGSGNPSA